MQPAACASIRGTVNASTPEDLILNRSANGSVMQALIILRFAVYGGFRIMLTHKDAKMMARSLRDALGNRNVLLSHSDCLEIVARQFGLADWNTLVAKLPAEEERHTRTRRPDTASPTTDTSSSRTEDVPAPSLSGVETSSKNDETAETTTIAAPWTTCSFCGKSRPEVRILFGGCGGWEGFRARRNPESGERSNVFICNECTTLAAQILARSIAIAKESDATGNPSATQ